jgi:dTDP-4-dehydrorhamnose reductase
MRILVTGASGLLGTTVIDAWAGTCELYGAYCSRRLAHSGVHFVQMDLRDREQVMKTVRDIRPQVIIHAAGLLVDASEAQPDLARAINVEGSRHLATTAALLGAKLIFISSDGVFDGEKGYYSEDDPPGPVNRYAAMKVEAEQIVSGTVADHVIVRTAFYGWKIDGANTFPTWIIENLSRGQRIGGLVDQYTSVMYAGDLAGVLRRFAESGTTGLFHVGSREIISKYDFAHKVADVFALPTELIDPITLNQLPNRTAKRPKDISLNVKKTQKTLEITLPSIEEGLRHLHAVDPVAYRSSFELG